jgi:hypothetical protein
MRTRWVGHVGIMRELRNLGLYKILLGKLEGRIHLGDLGVNGRVVFKWILNKYCVEMCQFPFIK